MFEIIFGVKTALKSSLFVNFETLPRYHGNDVLIENDNFSKTMTELKALLDLNLIGQSVMKQEQF